MVIHPYTHFQAKIAMVTPVSKVTLYIVLYSSICPRSFNRVRVEARTLSTFVLEANGPPTSMKPCRTIIIS